MPERWDCLYVDQIGPEDGRIYLKSPLKYGNMYQITDISSDEQKVRKSIPAKGGPIIGLSNESKVLKATAIATAFNRSNLPSPKSKGLVLRAFKGKTAYPGLLESLIKTQKETLRLKGSTDWIIYISPEEKFFIIINKYICDELPEVQSKKIQEYMEYLLKE